MADRVFDMTHWATRYLRHVLAETGETATGLAKRANVSSTTLTRPLNDPDHKFNLSSRTVDKIAALTGISPAPFIGGQDRSRANDRRDPQFAYVSTIDIEDAEAPGTTIPMERPIFELAFPEDWLSSMTSAKEDDLVVIRARGDSMQPTISDGDMMLIDRTKKNVNTDGLFVLRYEDVLRVKRIDRNPSTGALLVKSDNPVYQPFEVRRDDLDVVGRVIWLGRRI